MPVAILAGGHPVNAMKSAGEVLAAGEAAVKGDAVVEALHEIGFAGHSTREIAGEEAVLASRDFLLERGSTLYPPPE